jgi:DNA-binding NarL/FixJ family response regulator
MEEILEECVLVRSDLETMLSEFNRQSAELAKQLERKTRLEKVRTSNDEKIPAAAPAGVAPAPAKITPLILPERYRGVSQMLDKGFEAKEIAEDLQIGIGEIQLLSNLKKRVRQEKHTVN